MRILALDFGCKTGWASLTSGFVESGVQEFNLERGESPGMRFLRFNVWLDRMIQIVQPKIVVYERAHHRGGWATELLIGMITRLQEKCAAERVEYSPVHSSTLKKFATGSGRSDKTQMIKACIKRFPGNPPIDDNEADALLLLAYAREKLDE
jgi:Holliday junction resolvasome RuvABC endonuclease subunit